MSKLLMFVFPRQKKRRGVLGLPCAFSLDFVRGLLRVCFFFAVRRDAVGGADDSAGVWFSVQGKRGFVWDGVDGGGFDGGWFARG